MSDPWPFRSSLELGALPTAAPCACLHVKHVLWEWGLNGLAERAGLLVSELVTNAVNATGQPGQTVSVNLAGNAAGLLIEVRDADPRPPGPQPDGPQPPGPRPPGPQPPGPQQPGEDGVLLVAALSARWNWYLTEEPPGKVVWCELSADPPAPVPAPVPAPAGNALEPPLPRRVPRARPRPQAEIVTDLDILRRLRDHLLS
jgi:anti-sigma regulatory factor (Ser/Thr protein kinase)